MDTKNNMKQAVYELFGVGEDLLGGAAETAPAFDALRISPAVVSPQKAPPSSETSYFAPGTVIQGTLHSTGGIEVAGDFRGDIISEGLVSLHSDTRATVSAGSLTLSNCTLTGDAEVKAGIFIAKDSAVYGNIAAKDLQCFGTIQGDLTVANNTVLGETARVKGSIETASLSVTKGAVLSGRIEVGGTEP